MTARLVSSGMSLYLLSFDSTEMVLTQSVLSIGAASVPLLASRLREKLALQRHRTAVVPKQGFPLGISTCVFEDTSHDERIEFG